MCYDDDSISRHATILHAPDEEEVRSDLRSEAQLVIDVLRQYADDRGNTDALDHDKIFDMFVEEFQSLC